MYKNKSNGKNNISGGAIRSRRIEMGLSQRELADALQLAGLDIDKNAVQRIEAGKRFVTDIEIAYFARVMDIDIASLLGLSSKMN